MNLTTVPSLVYFDEEKKALMSMIVVGGQEIVTMLHKADVANANGDCYSEDFLRFAAKRFNELETKRIIGDC